MAEAKLEDLEKLVKTCGFYRNKAKNILAAAIMIVEDFDGEVPQTIEDLTKLPGAARKTANVVLGNAFDINEGMVVDTHIGRLESPDVVGPIPGKQGEKSNGMETLDNRFFGIRSHSSKHLDIL